MAAKPQAGAQPPAAAGTRGRFVTLEGGEGGGKSTQARLLADKLRSQGIDAIVTREPGGSAKAEAIRAGLLAGKAKALGPLAEALLFSAARIDHLDATIRPALAKGTWVVCDRFIDSTRAYQGALGDVDPAFIDALERVSVGATRPDLTLILDIAPAEGMARADRRRAPDAPADRFEAEGAAFHRGLRRAFLDIAAAEPKRCAVIDASQPAKKVAERIWSTLAVRLLAKPRRRAPAKSTRASSTRADVLL